MLLYFGWINRRGIKMVEQVGYYSLDLSAIFIAETETC